METMVITIAQEKGGASKSTTAVNLATLFALDGKKVLAIDLDPSSHATKILTDCEHRSEWNGRGVFDMLQAVNIPAVKTDTFIFPSVIENIKLIPSSAHTKQVSEVLRMHEKNYEYPAYAYLQVGIDKIEEQFDVIVIDTPPGLDEQVQAALFASTHIIIPTFMEASYVDGVTETYRLVKEIEANSGVELNILGILYSRIERQLTAYKFYDEEMKNSLYADLIFKSQIRKAQAVPDSMTLVKPVVLAEPSSKAAQDFRELYQEIKERIEC